MQHHALGPWHALALAAALVYAAAPAAAGTADKVIGLNIQVVKLYQQGRYADAFPLAKQALAGAQSQLVSLWKVDDDATAQLMGDYYRRLKQGEGRAQALRLAQATLRANPATAHPYYWAPFIPVGDWRPLTLQADTAATR